MKFDQLKFEICSNTIKEGRERKRRLYQRINNWSKVKRKYGKVPIHIDLFLKRTFENHNKSVHKARLIHVLFLNNNFKKFQHSDGQQGE